MSLVCTFVAIVTRLGLVAAPVGFPGHVHAWVALPSYQQSDPDSLPGVEEADWEAERPLRRLHVDVFHSETEPFLASEDMRRTLWNLHVPEVQWRLLMRPSSASEMVLRAANNVLHSVTRIQHQPTTHIQTETRAAALYASAMTFLVGRPQAADAARFVGGVVSVIKEQFPLDTEPVLSRLLEFVSDSNVGVTNPEIGMHLRNSIARLRDPSVEVKKRKNEKYWIGMIFRHAKFNYVGVILGWDEVCKAEERWMIEAGVDALPRGRGQPFYTVLAKDGSSRYVAEENVVQLPSLATSWEPEQNLNWDVVRALTLIGTSTIEQTFSRVEVDEELGRAWFVPAVSTAEEFPDDTALGVEYMQKP
ncbi:hemimethylated DNA-binding domain protein [Ceratobasidium sp. AG-Ba]|nr:hemimethylated DNA-binding domain protein [Ceratobasidium sp. AG-Ba]